MPEKNLLEELFRGLKNDLRLDAAKKSQSRWSVQPLKPSLSTYADPQNWTPGRAIQLIHASEGAVGVFREYFHKLSPTARRLLPAPAGTTPDTTELVFGDWWLHPRNAAPPPPDDTPAEEAAIRQRFLELIAEDYEDAE